MNEEIETRLFSLDEARQTLPLIEPIVRDLMACHRRLKERREDAEQDGTEELPSTDPSGSDERSCRSSSVEQIREELTSCMEEIYALGAEFQGFARPRIHFPTQLRNRIVYLCWEPEDESVHHWHESYAECDNRQPIEDQSFSDGRSD